MVRATSAALYLPYGVAVDSGGNLYIADTYNSRIRMVSNGVITTVGGNGMAGCCGDNGPAISAEFYLPVSVAVDASGNLYIADPYNQRIRKAAAGGTITTVAGNGIAGPTGDNGTSRYRRARIRATQFRTQPAICRYRRRFELNVNASVSEQHHHHRSGEHQVWC